MADDIKNLFGGFNAVVDQFIPSNRGGDNKSEDNELPEVNPDDVKKQMESLVDIKTQDDDSKKTPAKNKEDEPTIPKVDKEVKEDKKPDIKEEDITSKVSDDKDVEEIDVEEQELVEAFSDLFADELGWKYEDGKKPSNIKDIVKYMQDLVDENSKPKYATDEIKELDEFVRQGGDVREFYSKIYKSEVNTDDLDLTKENNQKAIIKENLRNRGYSEQRIDKLISRYEENDALEEESKDSLEEVKEYREKTKRELLETQKNQQETELQEQLSFVRNVEKIVKDIDNVRGIPISEKEKKELLEYIFKPDRTGVTNYQREYMGSLDNLVESAYFTKNRNTIVKEIQKRATSEAVKNLKLKLKTSGKSTKNAAPALEGDGGKVSQLWDVAGKELKFF